MPFSSSRAAAVSELTCERAPAPSVTLTASATPFNGATLEMRSARSQETGGTISTVTANLPDRRHSLKRFTRDMGM